MCQVIYPIRIVIRSRLIFRKRRWRGWSFFPRYTSPSSGRPSRMLSYLRVTTASAETEWRERTLSLAVDSNPKPSDCSAIKLPLPVLLSLLEYDSTNISGLESGSGHGAGALRPPYSVCAPAGTAIHSDTARRSDNRGDH